MMPAAAATLSWLLMAYSVRYMGSCLSSLPICAAASAIAWEWPSSVCATWWSPGYWCVLMKSMATWFCSVYLLRHRMTEFSGADPKIVGKSQPVQNSGPDNNYVTEVEPAQLLHPAELLGGRPPHLVPFDHHDTN
eukprot:COSAG01_NODE_3318_length_6272_cov_2.193261_6_plen_135_part_00